MSTLDVRLGGGYTVTVERGALARAGELFDLDRRVLIVTDSGVPQHYAAAVAAACREPHLVTVPAGEASKTVPVWQHLLETMLAKNFERHDCVVAVGGGMVGDLSGFAAACYMRGIDFYNVPTTLLSQVDAAVGGKTALNADGVKNAIGAFRQPRGVLIDPDVLATLPPRLVAEGMAEIVKVALTSDAALFDDLAAGRFESDPERIILTALTIKRDVVQRDEFEKGPRRVLNFGHTLGHGIEAAAGGALFHGECVALGMIPFCAPAVREKLLPLLTALGLPTRFEGDAEAVLDAVRHDKKSAGDAVTVVTVPAIGTYKEEVCTLPQLADALRILGR